MKKSNTEKLQEILDDEEESRRLREQRRRDKERQRVKRASIDVLLRGVIFVVLLVLWFGVSKCLAR